MDYIAQLISRYPELDVCKKDIEKTYSILETSFANGGKLIVAGNGGSAADCDHISGELLKSFVKKRKMPKHFLDNIKSIDKETGEYLSNKLQGSLPVIPLSNNSALMTATLNDIDGNVMFAQQVNGYGKKEDVFLGITTSGNSKDIIYAMVVAKAKGLKTIAFTGRDGGKIKSFADACIIVPQTETFMIQELHLPIYHALCLQIEERFFKE